MKSTSGLNLRLRWKQEDPSRQGVMMFLGIAIIIVLCGFAAFAIDLGYISLTQAQLQNAADAAALASVLELKTSDPTLSRDQMKANALAEALKAASLNRAAGRSVVLDPAFVVFGNRHTAAGGGFVTTFEGEPGFDDSEPLNAVKVDVTFGEAGGPRRELELLFARLLDRQTTKVNGASRAHLTPRDLVFCLDISNSMNDDIQGDQAGRITMMRKWFELPAAMSDTQITTASVNMTTPFGTGDGNDVFDAGGGLTMPSGSINGTNGSVYVISITNHGLQTGDMVRITGVTTGATNYGDPTLPASQMINRNWRVTVTSSSNFTLDGSVKPAGRSYTGSGGRVRCQGVSRSPSGGIRIRTDGLHGLLTGNLVTILNVAGGGSTAANGIWTITRVNNFNTNESSRFDLVGSTLSQANSDAYTLDSGDWRIPDIGTDTLNATQRNQIYKHYWLRMLDSNGTIVTTAGENKFYDAFTAQSIAALEFPSGETDTTYDENVDHPFYVAYDTTKTAATDNAKGTPTGAAYSYPNGHPWRHWKWRAFVNARFNANSGTTSYTFDKNVVGTEGMGNTKTLSIDLYALYCLGNGCVPALKGTGHFGRDHDKDNSVDALVPPATYLPPASRGTETYTDYPDYAGYYPKPAYQNYRTFGGVTGTYDSSVIDFTEGSLTAGVHPDNIPDFPFTYVRQATLNGINAMISNENAGNDAFDQVAMITYGTRAFVESDLTNDLALALKLANNRLCVGANRLTINPGGNGNTNIGGALRRAVDVLKNQDGYSRGRTYTNKTIALLTDGIPNISPSGGFTAPEFSGGTDTITNNSGLGADYARHWAQHCADNDIVIHTIGFGVNLDANFLQEIADTAGGLFFPIDDPANQVDELNNIFIAIGKDKLGKLFTN